jgi:hypothetical protein
MGWISAHQQPIAIQTAATGTIAIRSDHRSAANVRRDNSTVAMSRMTAGRWFREMTSPSANQQTAVRRGARRNSSAGTRATAFGQRSGFGSFALPVFEALPADRTHHHFTTGAYDYLRKTTTVSK